MWRRDFQFPPYVYNRGGLEKFLSLQKSSKKLKTVQDKLVTNNYMVRREKAILRGQWEDRISLVPLSPEPHPSIFRSPEKLIFMSATINELDITDLGISDNRKILKLELPSVIPSSRRPVIPLGVAGVSYSSLRTVAPVLVNYIKEIAEFHGAVKGFVHATYSTAAELRRYLSDDPRYIFHTSTDSKRRFDEWLESEDKIFIASGFEEGIDLKGDEFSWQILTRIPWPSLADPAIRKKVEVLGDSWYYWQTLKAVIQAYGRICRDVNDYGVTYVLDSNWDKLIRESGKYNFLPKFFEEAITD
jgi:Rad3-related DNA helicase